MALTNAQKDTILDRVLGQNGQAKTSGSALAKEYSVSPSAISNIKTKHTHTGSSSAPAKVEAPAKAAKKPAVKKKGAAAAAVVVDPSQADRVIIVHSSKFTGIEFTTKAKTFGAFLDQIGEDKNVQGIYKNAKKARKTLSGDNTPLPADNGESIHIYLAPLKTDSGK